MASRVEETASTLYPSSSRHVTMVVRTEASSSTISNLCIGSGRDLGLQYHGKARAFPWLAGDLDPAAVMGHNLFDDRKANSGSHFSRLFGALGPIELVKYLLHFVRIHTHALIAHRKP